MRAVFRPISYEKLNARQKESHNFQKISAVLADYGFTTIRLTDDWESADFLAVHADGKQELKVQLKSRLIFARKYRGKDLWCCFRTPEAVYLYHHDRLLKQVLRSKRLGRSKSWRDDGVYSYRKLPDDIRELSELIRLA